MFPMLLAIAVTFVIGFVAVQLGSEGYKLRHDLLEVVGFTLIIGAGIAALTYALFVHLWFAAGYKAEIINREYGTTYTREEVFWASDVIDTVRELNRQRVEVNGDLMHLQEKE